ncbi:MAG: efflux transporter periplasmic adaptor subunit, partial [Tannerella sp.]|nr:efflux transporter periplasmic adaptor subunit [Tannerella sp.]
MKKIIICFFIAIALITGGCHNEKDHAHATEDSHEHVEGDGHDHAACGHEDEDGHDHAARSHEEEDGDEAHTDEIRFSVAQAEAVGLEVQEVVPGTFHRVIKT